ncbi:MAG: antibiotic biosynthesis monooxygenase [Chlorobia bacterium]|nr:antibiotic biosynthesis monooxygenase [Fimbriimonadaceae bacterium]
MTVLTAYGFLHADKVDLFLSASKKNKALAVTETGCERFDYYISAEDALKFVFVEEWTTREDLEAHFQTGHFAEFMKAMGECLTQPPEIRIFQATLSE